MYLKIATEPTAEPVKVSDLVNYLRLYNDTGFENDILDELIKTARISVENDSRRALITQTWDYWLNDFPCEDYIKLPLGNLQTVTYVKYTDSDGTVMTMTANTDYYVETNGDSYGKVVLPYGVTWPSFTEYPYKAVNVRFVCGYGATASTVPAVARLAIKRKCAMLYFNRGAANPISDDVYKELIDKIPRLYDEF